MAPAKSKPPSDTSELQQQIATLQSELETVRASLQRESEDRNFFQLERDRVYSLYEISQRRLADADANLRTRDREIEELVEKHQVAVRTYQLKIKDLLYGHRQETAQLRLESEAALQAELDAANERVKTAAEERRALKKTLRETQLAHEEAIRVLQADHERRVSTVTAECDRRLAELSAEYAARTKETADELELLRRTELHELDERKNAHIRELLSRHDASYAEMKAYYGQVTQSSVELIKQLKAELAEMKKKSVVNEKLLFEVAAENRRLAGPLQAAVHECEELRRAAAAAAAGQASLETVREHARALEQRLARRQWESDRLAQQLQEVTAEKQALQERFTEAVEAVEEHAGMRSLVLERRLESMSEVLERKETTIGELVAAAGVSAPAAEAATARLDAVLAAKNAQLRTLQIELGRVTKRYNDAINVLGTTLRDSGFGTSPEELGFTTMPIPGSE